MTLPKVLRGKAWKFGVNIDTDQIIPAKYAIYAQVSRPGTPSIACLPSSFSSSE